MYDPRATRNRLIISYIKHLFVFYRFLSIFIDIKGICACQKNAIWNIYAKFSTLNYSTLRLLSCEMCMIFGKISSRYEQSTEYTNNPSRDHSTIY